MKRWVGEPKWPSAPDPQILIFIFVCRTFDSGRSRAMGDTRRALGMNQHVGDPLQPLTETDVVSVAIRAIPTR